MNGVNLNKGLKSALPQNKEEEAPVAWVPKKG